MHVLHLFRKQSQKVNFLDQLSRAFLSFVASGNLKYFLLWGSADHGKKDKLWCSCSPEAWTALQRLLCLGNKPGKPGGHWGVHADLQKTKVVCFWEGVPPAGTSKLPSCAGRQKGRNCSEFVCASRGNISTITGRTAHGIGSQEDTTQNQPQSHQQQAPYHSMLNTPCCSSSYLSWAGLFCTVLLWRVSSAAGCDHWLPCGPPLGRGSLYLVEQTAMGLKRTFHWICTKANCCRSS